MTDIRQALQDTAYPTAADRHPPGIVSHPLSSPPGAWGIGVQAHRTSWWAVQPMWLQVRLVPMRLHEEDHVTASMNAGGMPYLSVHPSGNAWMSVCCCMANKRQRSQHS